ncbi:MAG: type I 3-dehydroquinate dehydratase [Erysipelotrichaceae bacterium]|nr:type I 3-dehydroquinate dehydratase [Erysipelotrichaceae bacterium]
MSSQNRACLQVKNIVFGEGIPKICLPIVDTAHKDIIQTIDRYETLDDWDVVEIRLDFFANLMDDEAVKALLQDVYKHCQHVVLVTIRTKLEGGQIDLTKDDYCHLIKIIIDCGAADIIDLELSLGEERLRSLIEDAKSHDIVTLISSHDFKETPDNGELARRLTLMEALGGDLLKLACMPQTEKDVVRLQDVTFDCANTLHQPLITMSMGQMGILTRVTGELYGSTMTFATAGKPSAPGQIPLEDMVQVLDVIHYD